MQKAIDLMVRLFARLLRRPKLVLAAVAVVVIGVGVQARHTQFDASIKSLILQDDPDYEFYTRYKHAFGQDEIVVAGFEDEDIFTPQNMRLVRRLTERFEAVEKVYDVRSLSNAEYIQSTSDSFEAVPLVKDIPPDGSPEWTSIRATALGQAIFRRDLVSDDGRKTSIIVTFAAQKDSDYAYHQEIRAIERIVAEESAASGKRIHLTGEPYIDLRFLEYIHRDLALFIPLTCLMLAALLLLMLRSVRETLIALVAISACLMFAGGLIPLAGFKMDSVLAGLPSLVLCIAVTDAIHILHRYRDLHGKLAEVREAVRATLPEVVIPCFLTSLTTGIGFGSLYFNEVRPIKAFGVLAAAGVVACYPLCILTVLSLVQIWKGAPARQRAKETSSPAMARLTAFLIRRRWLVAGLGAAAVAVTAAGVARIVVQVDRVRYLKEESDVYQAIEFVEQNLAGTTQLDVWVEGGREGVVKEPATLAKIEGLAAFLRAKPEIEKVICINDFLKEMNKAFFEGDPAQYRLPPTREAVAQYLLIYSMSGRKNQLDRYVDYPYSRTRVSIRTGEHNSARLDALIGEISGYLKANFRGALRAELASAAIANNNVFHYLLEGLLVGVGTAVLVVGLMLCFAFRSVYAGLVSMIPNVLPLAACLGIMGWSGVWLEIATAMTFSIALGIAVDDTIHLFARYRMELARCGDYDRALQATFARIGWALVQTTTIIAGGFLVLVLASLKMNITFGLLSAFIMLVALAADLFLTPVVLLIFRPFRVEAASGGGERRGRGGVAQLQLHRKHAAEGRGVQVAQVLQE